MRHLEIFRLAEIYGYKASQFECYLGKKLASFPREFQGHHTNQAVVLQVLIQLMLGASLFRKFSTSRLNAFFISKEK